MLFQNKGARPTPTNLEWGTVEKMWITTGADLGPNDIPTDFRESDNKLKELQSILENLAKRAKAHQKAILASSQAAMTLAGHLSAVANALSDLQILCNNALHLSLTHLI